MSAELTAVPAVPAAPRPRTWLDRVCARLGGWCDLLRGAHGARVPF
jgi:hypothetical protein